MGYGTMTLRLKQSRSRTAPSSNKFSLAGTLSAIQITDVTSLSSPPLYNKAKGLLVDVKMSRGLSELLASITIGRAEVEQKVVSEEEVVEGEEEDKGVAKREAQGVEKAGGKEEKEKVDKGPIEAK